jgi:hypothetical protein
MTWEANAQRGCHSPFLTSRIYDFGTNCSLLHLFADIFTYPRPSVEKIAGNFTSCHVIAHICMYFARKKTFLE